jgi:hypothetical protein
MKKIFLIDASYHGYEISIMPVKTNKRRRNLSTIDNTKDETYNVIVKVTKLVSKFTIFLCPCHSINEN